MKIFIALLLLLGNVYIHAQSNYNELFTRGEEFRSKGLYTKALPYYEKAEKVVKPPRMPVIRKGARWLPPFRARTTTRTPIRNDPTMFTINVP